MQMLLGCLNTGGCDVEIKFGQMEPFLLSSQATQLQKKLS